MSGRQSAASSRRYISGLFNVRTWAECVNRLAVCPVAAEAMAGLVAGIPDRASCQVVSEPVSQFGFRELSCSKLLECHHQFRVTGAEREPVQR